MILLRDLEKHGYEFLRERGNYTIYVNRRAQNCGNAGTSEEVALEVGLYEKATELAGKGLEIYAKVR